MVSVVIIENVPRPFKKTNQPLLCVTPAINVRGDLVARDENWRLMQPHEFETSVKLSKTVPGVSRAATVWPDNK